MKEVISFEVDSKTGRTVITDDVLGKRTVEPVPLAIIEDQHRMLCAYRDDGRVPSRELLDDIAAYDSILRSTDPAGRAREYFELKARWREDRDEELRPRQVASLKGWKAVNA